MSDTPTPQEILLLTRIAHIASGNPLPAWSKEGAALIRRHLASEDEELRTWTFCPECGSADLHHEEGEHKQCKHCHQEWFSSIDYRDVTAKNLARLTAQLAAANAALAERAKLAPVQGYAAGIPWSMHLRAYDAYCKRWSPQQALITGGCRGGFHTDELDMLIPGWRDELSELSQLQSDLATRTQTEAGLREQVSNLKTALRFYAGRVRKDGNGYEFDRESYTGDKARKALSAIHPLVEVGVTEINK